MDPELKRMLDETRILAKDNNRMLHAIRRHQWYGFLTTIVFWLVIFVAPFYLYQLYVQPLVEKFSASPGDYSSGALGLPTSAELQKLIDSFKSGQ